MNLAFKKHFRLSFCLKNISIIKNYNLRHGNYGLQAFKSSIVTYTQINSFRIKLSRSLKKIGNLSFKIYIRIFFLYPLTKKPKLSRMGKGSGPIHLWVGCLKPGLVFLELHTIIPKSLIKRVCFNSSYLLPINFMFVENLYR